MNFFDNTQNKKKLEKVYCRVPTTEIHIYDKGKMANCCFSWLPTYIGNINEIGILEAIESQIAREIQSSVNDGSFKFCDSKTCPVLGEYINYDKIIEPLIISEKSKKPELKSILLYLDYDPSCNLYCGSCRTGKIHYTFDSAPDHLVKTHEKVFEQINLLLARDYKLTLNITGSGDPYASVIFWDLLQKLPDHPNLYIHLSTNGTLMTAERLHFPYAKRVEFIGISIDAATEKTYSQMRRGGSFYSLANNLTTLDYMINKGYLPQIGGWRANFVVQSGNYHEMIKFAEWLLSYKSIGQVWFNLIADWGHLTPSEFEEKAIWKSTHPDNAKFMEIIKDPIFSHPKVFLGSMAAHHLQAINEMNNPPSSGNVGIERLLLKFRRMNYTSKL